MFCLLQARCFSLIGMCNKTTERASRPCLRCVQATNTALSRHIHSNHVSDVYFLYPVPHIHSVFIQDFYGFNILLHKIYLKYFTDRPIIQAVSHRRLNAETRVQSQASPSEIYIGQNCTRAGFSPSTSVSPANYYSTRAVFSRLLSVSGTKRLCLTPQQG
jgi:hypothetical protein